MLYGPFIQIDIDAKRELAHSRWLRAVDSYEYRLSITQSYKAIKINNAVCWLADFTRLSTPNMHDQKWTASVLSESLLVTKLRKIAFLLPDNLFMEVVIEKITEQLLQKTDNQIKVGLFSTLDLALEWLGIHPEADNILSEDFNS